MFQNPRSADQHAGLAESRRSRILADREGIFFSSWREESDEFLQRGASGGLVLVLQVGNAQPEGELLNLLRREGRFCFQRFCDGRNRFGKATLLHKAHRERIKRVLQSF